MNGFTLRMSRTVLGRHCMFVVAAALAILAPRAAQGITNTFTDEGAFLATLRTSITDTYATSLGYPAPSATISNAAMSAVLGETAYTTTGHANTNKILDDSDPLYCAGCNGSFRLDFTSTSVGGPNGVFGVGFSFRNGGGVELQYTAFVTFGDDSTQNFLLPLSNARPPIEYFGITSDLRIKTVHLGLADGGATTSGSFQMDNLTIGSPECTVSINKQVSCDGENWGDGPCIGWNASSAGDAEPISLRYVIRNTSGVGGDVFGRCTVTEDNNDFQRTIITGVLGTTPGFDSVVTNPAMPTCDDGLDEEEPEHASVSCECADDLNEPATAEDTAGVDFECQTPELNITKSCVPTGNPTGDPTVDYLIEVTNPGVTETPATLDNCVVDDGLAAGACSEEQEDPTPTLTSEVGTLFPEDSVPVDFLGNTVNEISCNVAWVTCDVRGSGGKQISEHSDDQCVPPPPLPDCRDAQKNVLSLKADGSSKWKWKKGAATTAAEFGDPTTGTDYRVCIYDGVGGVQNPPVCSHVPAGTGWEANKKGFKFKSDSGVDGITKITLKEGEAGKAKILVKGTDAGATLPLTENAVVQISNSNGLCWESLFTTFQKNDAEKVKAK